jgi:RES domain
VIVFRHADSRLPFFWETGEQPPARWHGAGEGPVAYLAETPDGAWAEFLRHEEITDPADLEGVRRAIWAVEVPELPRARPRLPKAALTGGLGTWPACQAEARRLRRRGTTGIATPSAALLPRTSSGFRTSGGMRAGPVRHERAFVLFGARPDLVAWCACAEGRPRADLLARVRHLRQA